MSMYLYNSLTKKKEEFLPQSKNKVKIYTCGVTVYDECHLGHARSLFIFDVIVRYLKYSGYKIKFIRNITDIDDKIISRAKQLNISWEELSERYIQRYRQDLLSLGIQEADIEPRATNHIPDMINMIETLLKKKFAYEVEGNVYFQVDSFPRYGRLSSQDLRFLKRAVRIEPDERKRQPWDFALWKASSDEPSWRSPWGRGRPGWHIECSAMSIKYLGPTLDIHGGGRDLIFPHHENEIAQSESFTGKMFSRFWLHHGLLTINREKMAKSLGNFVSVPQILKDYSVDTLKIFFLSTHYSSDIDFSSDKLIEAEKANERFEIALRRLEDIDATNIYLGEIEEIKTIYKKFQEAMDNDFNTPSALASLYELTGLINKFLSCREDIKVISLAKHTLLELGTVLGLFQRKFTVPTELILEIEKKIKERALLRKRKEFYRADIIRKELLKRGIILEDQRDGTTTWRVTKDYFKKCERKDQ